MATVFIGDAIYALMLYMLYATDEALSNATYFVGRNCAGCNLPNKVVMPLMESYTDKELFKYRLKCLKYRNQLRHSEIFAQDHVFFAPALIDNLPYNVLEDCPNFFIIREERNEINFKSSLGNLWYNFKVGRIYQRYAGHNPWCKKRIITSDRDCELFERQELAYDKVSLKDLWSKSSAKKKKFIVDVFALPPLDEIQKDIVLFSQPLCEDANMSEEEVVSIFRPYIDKYGTGNVLVKIHPRDKFDYQKNFPGVSVLRTKAPQQLLDLMGVKFRTAITVCSSAVSSMDKDCDIIWMGAEIDERIVKAYGHIDNPRA